MAKSFKISFQPAQLLQLAALFAEEEGTTLLYSGGPFDSAQKSFLFLFPIESVQLTTGTESWEVLHSKLQSGFWNGYLGYEMGAHSDPEITIKHSPSSIPDAFFQRCAFRLVLDHSDCQAAITVEDEDVIPSQYEWLKNKENFQEFILNPLPPFIPPKIVEITKPLSRLEDYKDKIESIKELIYSGDLYQVNLSHQLEIESEGLNSFSLFCHLAALNPAPFSAYIKQRDFTIVSSSPERFLKKEKGILETRPIKGTAPRGKNPEEDQRNSKKLLESPKENAELLMITDLMRNDLGKVSLPGSVETLKMHHCEVYANVYHLLSVIRSQAKPELSSAQIVRACFPGGSISGCPKLRAMEVIQQMEGRPREIYTGSIGYFSPDGDFDFNIVIRTLLIKGNRASLQLGGGIVADSDGTSEYQETMHKGYSILKAFGIN